MAPFERLDAWKLSFALALEIYKVTASFPKHELYGLTSQIRRAACSVVFNIAEGSAKRGPREFQRYLNIALGSLSELTCELRLAKELGLLTVQTWTDLEERRNNAGATTWKLYEAMRNKGR